MNQEQVKAQLLKLNNDVKDFNVTFSGKNSKRVDGLYIPDKKEIIIHNKNFKNDNELIYTAIHEFAHHIQFTTLTVPISLKAHTVQFWNIFHTLLYKAEELGIYLNIFKENEEFKSLTQKVKDKFLTTNGQLIKEFGKLLIEAKNLCLKYNTSFEDYLDRILSLPRNSARSMIKAQVMDLNPAIGFENMKTVASIKDDTQRHDAEQAFMHGMSPDMVKMQFRAKPEPDDPVDLLKSERKSIEKRIHNLEARLIEVDKRISHFSKTTKTPG